jgi:hypothetical protein
MAKHERRPSLPTWAERERAGDLAWIGENLQEFWKAARSGYEASGRGALVVDTAVQPTGAGQPFGYVLQEQIRQLGAKDEIRMIATYDPSWELVIVLLKPEDRLSSYRVGVPVNNQE